jgi:hypothetical protein
MVAGAASATGAAVRITQAAIPALTAAEVAGADNAVAAQLGVRGHRRQGQHHGKPYHHLCFFFHFLFSCTYVYAIVVGFSIFFWLASGIYSSVAVWGNWRPMVLPRPLYRLSSYIYTTRTKFGKHSTVHF